MSSGADLFLMAGPDAALLSVPAGQERERTSESSRRPAGRAERPNEQPVQPSGGRQPHLCCQAPQGLYSLFSARLLSENLHD